MNRAHTATGELAGSSTGPIGEIVSRFGLRIPELDGLRGLAILLVVICHYVGGAEHASLGFWPHHLLTVLGLGWSGVDLFFVLSGFLIGGILIDARDSARYFQTFYLRRAHRILPIYYIWILMYAVIVAAGLWLTPGWLPVTGRDLRVAPIYLAFLQNMIYGQSPFQARWFGVTWSLAVEEQFYLLAPWLIRFVSTKRLAYVLSPVVLAAPVLRFLAFRYLPNLHSLPQFGMPFRADTLSLGILVAVVWRNHRFRKFLRQNPLVLQRCVYCSLFLVAGLLWWLVRPAGLVTFTIGFSVLAFFYASLVLLVISQTDGPVAQLSRASWLRYLGGISYCVYLIHFTLDEWAHILLLHAKPRVSDFKGVGVTLLAGALTLMVASFSWKYIEQPLIRIGHRQAY